MTDFAARPQDLTATPAVDAVADAEGATLGETVRWAIAGLSGAAGVIHLAMAPSHFSESTTEGMAFLAAGWFQLLVAGAAVARPRRWLLALSAAANALFIAAWAVTRTAGSPWGSHAGHPESAGFVDVTCVGLEAALVVLSVAMLARKAGNAEIDASPRMAPAGAVGGAGVQAFIVPVAAAILATAAITSPSARDHASASHGGHAEMTASADAHVHGHDHGHGHALAGTDDKGFSLLANGHQHDRGVVELDPETQARLDAQLEGTKQLIDKYPNIAAAEAAGYRRAGPFAPGLGIHYQPPRYHLNADGVIDDEDLAHPMLIFDGTGPDAKLAGFMYSVFSQTEPEGFAGPNDHWHYHSNVCIVPRPDGVIDTPFGADLPGVTKEMCDGVGGRFLGFTGYMVHVWTVPGYESEMGVFSELNPAITCPDGTYYMLPIEEIAWKTSACRDA